MKGLKQLVEEALDSVTPPPAIPPVDVSDEARTALAYLMRKWSGWPGSTIKFGKPEVSPYAQCDHNTKTFTANVDVLLLNPNRVLNTITPFRLKQEAVLTGCLLHEAGHARHSLWKPRTEEALAAFVHGDTGMHEGEPVNKQTMGLATLMEEPRVEGLMLRNGAQFGAENLTWTMRASGAHLAPFTNLSADPNQRVMDMITSWALRAGKQYAIMQWQPHYRLPMWVADLTSLLHGVIVEHLNTVDVPVEDDQHPTHTIARTAQKIIDQLMMMAVCTDDRGTYMVDAAREVLDMLFPETDGSDENAPQVGEGCTAAPAEPSESESGDEGEGDEEGEGGEGNTEPEDEGEGEDPGEGDKGSEVSDESDTSEDSESDEPAQEGDPGGAEAGTEIDADSDLAKALRALEADSKNQTEDEAEDLAEQIGGTAGGEGSEGGLEKGWRHPTKDEREIQKGAERFLRLQIEPTERSKVSLTDTPSSSIDGAAYESWASSGRVRAPHFFKQTRRTVEPSPPVRIATLVDVSGSMDELQEPSAVLSWALASAALDLRNFAGRGQQIESCLIHWGSHARVIQETNKQMPGLREFICTEGTSAFPAAMELVEEQMPGFFDTPATPVNRLLVNFTDWDFGYSSHADSTRWIARTLESGINMLNVVPSRYNVRRSNLPDFLAGAKVQRGKSSLIKYNPGNPGQVWDSATEMLDGGTPAPFAGF